MMHSFPEWTITTRLKIPLSKGIKATLIGWGNQILANPTNYGVKILWQILTITKETGTKNCIFLASISEWSTCMRSHEFRKIMSHSLALPKHLVECEDMVECCAKGRLPVVLWWAVLLGSYSLSSPCLVLQPLLGTAAITAWNAPTASTTLSNDNEGWWEESSLRGNLKGQQGPIGKKVRTEQLQNSNRKEHMGGRLSWNSHPSVTLLLLLLLRFFPFPTAQVSQSEKKNHDVLRKRKFSSPSSCETSLLSNT